MVTPHAEHAIKRVVVVEDDPAIGVLMASVLADAGYAPFVVQDGWQALRLVRELRPDAITLDLQLPGFDGHALLRKLEGDESHRPLPGRGCLREHRHPVQVRAWAGHRHADQALRPERPRPGG